MQKGVRGLLILHFLNDGVRTTFVTLLPFISRELSLSLSVVGFLGSAQPLIASILALPAGFIGSRIGGFHSLIFLLIIYSIGALLASVSFNIFFLMIAFSLGALGFGMFHTISFALIAKISDKSNMGKNMANFTSIGDIGRVLIPPIAIFLTPFFGWRLVMAGLALGGLGAFLLLRFLIPKKEEHHLEEKEPESHKDFLKTVLILLKTKKLALTLLASVFDSLASSPVYLFLPFLLFSKGIQITEFGFVAAVFLLGSLTGKSILGRSVDRFGNLKVFMVSETFMAISLILLTLVSNIYIIMLIAFILASFTRGTTPVIQAMFSESSHSMHYNKIFALSEMFIGLASVATIILMGLIADNMGVVFVYYLSAIFGLLAILPTLVLRKNTRG